MPSNNNDLKLTNNTYSPIFFSNPDSIVCQSRMSISYFNKLMRVSIALRSNPGSNSKPTYDNENSVDIYLSYAKAYTLLKMINYMLSPEGKKAKIHNVCVETNIGLIKVSDGGEFGSDTPCISISTADNNGTVSETIYQTRNMYKGIYNYTENKYSSKDISDLELDTFRMTLSEYYKASSYAIAATVMEANMYKRNYTNDLIKSIAGDSTSRSYSNNNQARNSVLSGAMNMPETEEEIPEEYSAATFDDIAKALAS